MPHDIDVDYHASISSESRGIEDTSKEQKADAIQRCDISLTSLI